MIARMRWRPTARAAGLTDSFVVTGDRDRQALGDELAGGLAELARRADQEAMQVLDVQLLAQVCAAPSYPEWKAGREAAWRKHGAALTTASWPSRLQDGELAVLLLPISAGRVGLAVGKHPRAIATPLFSAGRPRDDRRYEDLLLGLVTNWVTNPGLGTTARLAPPVVEVVQRGRVVEREVADLGQRWPLPAPDGL